MPHGPLVDTSVLVDYFRGARNWEADVLDRLLGEGPAPATAPIIVQEYFQGFSRVGDFKLAVRALALFDRLPPANYALHRRAARLHIRLKRRGVTASTVDTLIVAMALVANRHLLTRDDVQKKLARLAGVALAE